MNADEIVATIRKLMPCINDCMDLYEYERQALTQAADLITAQQAEIDRLTALSKEAAELVGLAIEQLKRDAHCLDCQSHANNGGSCYGVNACRVTNYHEKWQWQHANRYEALKMKT